MNRKERRQAQRRNGRLPGETLAESIQRKKKTNEAYANAVVDDTLDIKTEIRVQRVLWMCCIAMHRAFGIGANRFRQFTQELDIVSRWYVDNKKKGRGDDVYANEMLRREASRIAGMEVSPLYDEEMMESLGELKRARTVGDRIRDMTDSQLAEKIFHIWQATVNSDSPFMDISQKWCHGDEATCGDCTDEKILACIEAWLKSPMEQKEDDTVEKETVCEAADV